MGVPTKEPALGFRKKSTGVLRGRSVDDSLSRRGEKVRMEHCKKGMFHYQVEKLGGGRPDRQVSKGATETGKILDGGGTASDRYKKAGPGEGDTLGGGEKNPGAQEAPKLWC